MKAKAVSAVKNCLIAWSLSKMMNMLFNAAVNKLAEYLGYQTRAVVLEQNCTRTVVSDKVSCRFVIKYQHIAITFHSSIKV